MGHGLPEQSGDGGMRHRFHSICPYFAMFPETFVEKHLAASPHDGVVFDPFCGRGTTMFQALLQGRDASGCDLNPVAVCISGAKCAPPERSEAEMRLDDLRRGFREPDDGAWQGDLGPFFDLCFHHDTLRQVRYLRSALDWRHRKDDRFIAALCLGALHGESHRSPNCFSNRMPRTISTKPGYSVRWWRQHGYVPPRRDVFEILERMIEYRFRTRPPAISGGVLQADAGTPETPFLRLPAASPTSSPHRPTSTRRTTGKINGCVYGSSAVSRWFPMTAATIGTMTRKRIGSSCKRRGRGWARCWRNELGWSSVSAAALCERPS